jgi:hypothetical protein
VRDSHSTRASPFRTSVNGADGIGDVEGKAARVAASSRGKLASFKSVVLLVVRIRVHSWLNGTQLDGELLRTDKGSVGKGIKPEERTSDSPLVGLQNPPHAPWQKRIVQCIARNRKMMRLFLLGMLCGVMITTAFTYVFAIPANSDHWRWEIWKRGGGAWTMDMKNGHTGWKWMVEPISDTPHKKKVVAPPSAVKVRDEQL